MLILIAAMTMAAQAIPAPPSTPAAPTIEAQNTPRIRAASELVKSHQSQAALDMLTEIVASYQADLAKEKRRIYCGMSLPESILYAGMAAHDKVGAVIVQPGYCTALFLKGYALVDLGRVAEAKTLYQQLIALAPMYAQYKVEFGQLIRLEKDWPRMLSICAEAGHDAQIAPPTDKAWVQGAALRCQGYALVEEHKLDEAETRYRQALAINPDDQKSQGELRYIAQQRAKP